MKKILSICLISVILTGCFHSEIGRTEPAETELNTTTEPTVLPSDPTAPPTEAPTLPPTEPPTEPVLYLDKEAGIYQENFQDEIENKDMDYYLFIPENATQEMPLVVFLHGDGEVNQIEKLENNSLMSSVWEIYGDNFPFIAISPCTRAKSWIDWYIPRTLKNLIDSVAETYNVDTDHIIITGHSRGAVGVWHMVNKHGDYFSAAVPISCYAWEKLKMDTCTKVPIRAFCGTYEEFERKYSGTMEYQISQISSNGGDAKFTLFSGLKHAETPAAAYTKELFEWMLSQ
jgi:predicted peptidase